MRPFKRPAARTRALLTAMATGSLATAGPLAASTAALAQPSPAFMKLMRTPVIPPQPGYVAPRISEDYVRKLRKLPDWNGSWATTGGLLLDPVNKYEPPNNDEAFDTGPLEGSRLTAVPYKPEYQKLYDETIERAKKGEITDPVGGCRQPHAMPRQIGGSPGGPEIFVTPDEVRMTWYWFNATRRIYTDGRPHKSGDDLVSSFMGDSIGRWEGDTLVVDTIGLNPGIYDRTGAPYSDKIHVTERIRMIAPDVLEDRMTMEDPVMLTRPWTVTRTFVRTSKVQEFEGAYCEGGRLEMVNGVQHLVLPAEAGK